MNGVEVAPVTRTEFTASASLEGGRIQVRFVGNADMRSKDQLDQFLNQLHLEAMRCRAPEVVVDFQELEFMNSSCFKSFITWITSVQDLGPSGQYNIRFLSRPTLLWQKRSLHAMRCFAPDLLTIES
jgi:hypothetical protein